MFLKGYPMEAKNGSKNWNQSVHIFWARLASFGNLGIISLTKTTSALNYQRNKDKSNVPKLSASIPRMNAYLKFGEILPIGSQDIEWKRNFGVNKGP